MQESSLAKIPPVDVKLELDDPSIRGEAKKATLQLKVGKSPGTDGIPAEVYQYEGEAVLHKLQDLRDAVIVSLYKNEGEKSNCSNYRGITLLSIAGQISARVLLNRLIPTIAQGNTPESQCGFRYNRGTADMIFMPMQILKKYREQNVGLADLYTIETTPFVQ